MKLNLCHLSWLKGADISVGHSVYFQILQITVVSYGTVFYKHFRRYEGHHLDMRGKLRFTLFEEIPWSETAHRVHVTHIWQPTHPMGRYALSLNQWRHNPCLAKETTLCHALDAFHAGQHSSIPSTAGQVAGQFGISKITLWQQVHSGHSNKEAHKAFQLLMPIEEDVLIHLAWTLAVWLLLLSHALL